MPVVKPSSRNSISPAERRRSIVAAYANGGLWGMGTGLASTTLVTYLAREYDATGLAIGWIIAAPALVGLLRLLTPMWLDRVGSRRRFSIAVFLASAVVLFALPIISAPHVLPEPVESLWALGITWAGYHVLEYIGTVALWSWLGDLVPRRIRGRFVGRRQAWANVGKVLGTISAAAGTYLWHDHCEQIGRPDLEWQSYAACGLAGAICFALSTWPLARMADLPLHTPDYAQRDSLWSQLFTPWADRRFRRLLCFGLWFSFSNGLMQTAQWMFQAVALNLSFVQKKTLDFSSRGIQASLMPSVGNWVDRSGNVRVLVLSQIVIAAAPLFFIIATPERPWWILGAYVCWLAYAGDNVAQPNLMLGLSPKNQSAAYASAWFAWGQLAFSLSSLLGGVLFDWMAEHFSPTYWGPLLVDHYAVLFLASFVLKMSGVWWAARIQED